MADIILLVLTIFSNAFSLLILNELSMMFAVSGTKDTKLTLTVRETNGGPIANSSAF